MHGSLPPRHTLSVRDFAVLEPFYRAQESHGKIRTWRQLRKAGFKPIEKETIDMKFICDTFNRDNPDSTLNYENFLENCNAKK